MFTEKIKNIWKCTKGKITLNPLPKDDSVNRVKYFSSHFSLSFLFLINTNTYFVYTEYVSLIDQNWKMFKRAT